MSSMCPVWPCVERNVVPLCQAIRVGRNLRFGSDPNSRTVYANQAELTDAMKVVGIDASFIVVYMVGDLLANKPGPFSLVADDYKFSTKDPLSGYVYWYIMKHFSLAGITQGDLVDVPGLSVTVKVAGQKSEWETMRAASTVMLAKFAAKLKDDTPDLFHVFFQKSVVRATLTDEDDEGRGLEVEEEILSQADSVDAFVAPGPAGGDEATAAEAEPAEAAGGEDE